MKTYPKALLRAAALLVVALLVGGAARAESGVDSWSALQDSIDRAEDGEIITLSEDLKALDSDAQITIPAGKRLTLDLNGHVLDSAMNPRQTERKRCVIKIREGAMLTLRDSGGSGVLTGGFHDNGGGVWNLGTLIMEGGCVTGNTALESGGGVANYGTMVLTGGSVQGNTALRDGGEVFNEAKARLTVGGDVVIGNDEAKHSGIRNEGALTVIGAQNNEARIEDMPTLKHVIANLSAIPIAVLLLALLLTVWLDAYLSAERKRVMVIIVALVFSLILQNYMDNRLSLAEVYNALRIPVSIYGYAIRPVILVMFLYIVKPRGRYRVAWAMVGANAAVYLTAFFSNIAFYFSSNGHFHAGPLRHTCTLISAVLYAWLFWLTMRQFRPRQRRESWIPILVTALIGGAAIMDFTVAFIEQPVAYLTMAIAISQPDQAPFSAQRADIDHRSVRHGPPEGQGGHGGVLQVSAREHGIHRQDRPDLLREGTGAHEALSGHRADALCGRFTGALRHRLHRLQPSGADGGAAGGKRGAPRRSRKA